MTTLYQYRAKVVKVYDGDTITVDVDLGFNIWMRGESVRLLSINSPEVRGVEREQGLIARDALRDKILDKDIIIRTEKDSKGKYGRYLGTIILEEDGEELNINDWLVENGYAEYKEY